jgi:hypothetical protein
MKNISIADYAGRNGCLFLGGEIFGVFSVRGAAVVHPYLVVDPFCAERRRSALEISAGSFGRRQARTARGLAGHDLSCLYVLSRGGI